MSARRRKNRSSELSDEALSRAREQVALSGEAQTPGAASASERRRRPSGGESSQARLKRKNAEAAVLTPEMVEEALDFPTKEVSPEELKAQYSYVVADLRSMGLLAAGLMVLLVVLAQVLPR